MTVYCRTSREKWYCVRVFPSQWFADMDRRQLRSRGCNRAVCCGGRTLWPYGPYLALFPQCSSATEADFMTGGWYILLVLKSARVSRKSGEKCERSSVFEPVISLRWADDSWVHAALATRRSPWCFHESLYDIVCSYVALCVVANANFGRLAYDPGL